MRMYKLTIEFNSKKRYPVFLLEQRAYMVFLLIDVHEIAQKGKDITQIQMRAIPLSKNIRNSEKKKISLRLMLNVRDFNKLLTFFYNLL